MQQFSQTSADKEFLGSSRVADGDCQNTAKAHSASLVSVLRTTINDLHVWVGTRLCGMAMSKWPWSVASSKQQSPAISSGVLPSSVNGHIKLSSFTLFSTCRSPLEHGWPFFHFEDPEMSWMIQARTQLVKMSVVLEAGWTNHTSKQRHIDWIMSITKVLCFCSLHLTLHQLIKVGWSLTSFFSIKTAISETISSSK